MIATAKVFKTGGGQAVRLPKAFRFNSTEVTIERKGDSIVLREKKNKKPKTLLDLAKVLREKHGDCSDFPDPPPRPKHHERPLVDFD